MTKKDPSLNTIPVTLLKRRKRANRDLIKAQRERSIQLRQRARARQGQIRRPAYFIAAARKCVRDDMRLCRQAKQNKLIFASDSPRLGIVLRLKRETVELSQTCLDVFKLLRLDTYNQAVFLKITPSMVELLSLVQPYIAWGYPNLQTVRDLITKRGRTLLGQRKHSIDNKLIEEKLGSFGILCLDDVIHELVTVGSNITAVLGFLQPFKLLPPSRGWLSGRKRCHARADKLVGMREENINEMLKRMI